jgi:probable rRNA maturation factor
VDEVESEHLNSVYRGQHNATNVLSFPAEVPPIFSRQLEINILGDIVICPAILQREADEQGKSPEAHWTHLLIHGVLHLLGYDHETDITAATMEQLEINILEKLGFPNPYLVG